MAPVIDTRLRRKKPTAYQASHPTSAACLRGKHGYCHKLDCACSCHALPETEPPAPPEPRAHSGRTFSYSCSRFDA